MAPKLRELPSYSLGGSFLTNPSISSAIRQHELGEFRLSANLVDVMMRDDRLAGLTRTRIQGLLGLPMDFHASGDKRRGKKVAGEAKDNWQAMFPESQLYSWMFWGLYLGVGVAQNVVDTKSVPGRWLPRMRVWHPMNLRWDWTSRRYLLSTEDGIVPIEQDDPEWCLFLPYGYERGWMHGLVRNVATSWLARQWALRDWSRYSEVHGMPIKMAIVPQAGAEAEDKERWARQVNDLGTETTLRAAWGDEGNRFDFQYREPTGDSHECFQKLMDLCNTNLAVTLLGNNLTSEVKEGSLAAARVGDAVRADLRAFDAQTMAMALRDGALKRWAKWNFDDAELAPIPEWQVDPPADLKNAALGLQTFGLAVTALKTAGVRPDVEELCEEYGIPSLGPLDEDEEAAQKKEASDRALQLAEAQKPDSTEGEQAGEPETGAGKAAPPVEETKRQAASATGEHVKPLDSSKQLAKVVQAQSYLDALADDAIRVGKNALAPDLKVLMGHIRDATDPDDLKHRLIRAYSSMDSERLTAVVEKALIISEMKGALAVMDEL